MLLLQSQGLLKFHTGKAEMTALSIIEHLGYVQIDTLAVVARAHHHTLWTRFSEYNEQILTELLDCNQKILNSNEVRMQIGTNGNLPNELWNNFLWKVS